MLADGFDVWSSPHSPAETAERLRAAIASAGLTLFAEIDHAEAARRVGLELLPALVLIFGNPRAGTPLMAACPSLAIDLPLKALVWQDAGGRVWIGFNQPSWLAARHHLPPNEDATVAAMTKAQLALQVEAAG